MRTWIQASPVRSAITPTATVAGVKIPALPTTLPTYAAVTLLATAKPWPRARTEYGYSA